MSEENIEELSTEQLDQSRINFIEYIQGLIALLIRRKAVVEGRMKFGEGDTNKNTFLTFFITLNELYTHTANIIEETKAEEIKSWLLKNKNSGGKDWKKEGLGLAQVLLDELEAKGMKKLFYEPIEPPFMLEDLSLLEAIEVGHHKGIKTIKE